MFVNNSNGNVTIKEITIVLLIICAEAQNLFFVGSPEVLFKAFLLFFLFSDWVESSQKSNRKWFFFTFFAPNLLHQGRKIQVTNYAANYGAKQMFRKPSSKLPRRFLSVEPTTYGRVTRFKMLNWYLLNGLNLIS